MLCQFAAVFGASGIGIDIYAPLVDVARQRAAELGVADKVQFVEGDAAAPRDFGLFDIVSCIGATWIGGGLAGTLEVMRRHVVPGGWFTVGECFWAKEPSPKLAQRYGQEFSDLAGTGTIFETRGIDLVEMVITNADEWDRYAASQWLNVSDWLLANPDHPQAAAMRAQRDESRHDYLADGRDSLGSGVFVGRDGTVERLPGK